MKMMLLLTSSDLFQSFQIIGLLTFGLSNFLGLKHFA